MLALDEFCVRYPRFTLGPLRLRWAPGECTAILGANGSGKTTMLSALAGRLPEYDGVVRADGVDVRSARTEHRARTGFLPDRPLGFAHATVARHLRLLSQIHSGWDVAYAEALRTRLMLPLDARIGTLSRGMGVKLAFISAEAFRPPYLVLDEPTSGLDPLARLELVSLVRELLTENTNSPVPRTILFSTHILEDVERLADRIIVLRNGAVAADVMTATLRATADGSLVDAIRAHLLPQESTNE